MYVKYQKDQVQAMKDNKEKRTTVFKAECIF